MIIKIKLKSAPYENQEKKPPKTNFSILLMDQTYQYLIHEAHKVIFKLVLERKKIKKRQKTYN